MSYYSRLNTAAQEALDGASRTAETLIESYFNFWLHPFSPSRTKTKDFGPTLARLRRLVQEALGESGEDRVGGLLSRLSARSEEIERAVVVWVELIEVLVQQSEKLHGTAPGQGALKASEVKAVVQHLFKAQSFQIPDVPRFLMPALIDIFTNWTIDAVVLMANQYGLWVVVPEPPPPLWRRILSGAVRFLSRLLRPLWLALAAIYVRLWVVLRPRAILSASLRSALKAVELEGLIVSQREFLEWTVETLNWLGSHQRQIIEATQLVFEAVQEAEKYREMSGPQKKQYAYDLVLAVLDEMGLESRAGLLYAVVASLLNGTIEASVMLFHKRNVFVHH